MMIRISLIVAIVAGLAVAVINLVQVKEVITSTRAARDQFEQNWNNETSAHSKTKKELAGTQAELATTKDNLRVTTEARDNALADAESNRKRAADLNARLQTTTRERDDAQAELAAWSALGIPVDQIKTLIANYKEAQARIAAMESENKILLTQNRGLQAKIDFLLGGPDHKVRLPEGLRATITAVDPKWEFVVLNAGEDQGVLEHGELLVNRNGKLVAKVRVSMVHKDRSIANLVSGWKLGDVIEGDAVIPAYY